MTKNLLIDSATGGGRADDEADLAGALRLLRQRGAAPVVGVSPAPRISARLHPGARFRAPDALAEAFANCDTACVVGALSSAPRLLRAARFVAQAKLSGVPVALLGVRVPPPHDAEATALVSEILCHAEAIAAADADTARLLARASGRRVETYGPMALLALAASAPKRRRERPRWGVDAALLDAAGAAKREALAAALGAAAVHAGAEIVVLGATARGAALDLFPAAEIPAPEGAEAGFWLAGCDAVLAGGAPEMHALALACGAVPVALLDAGEPAPLHARLGLADVALPLVADAGALAPALARALARDARALCARAAPLRALAARASGALADAARARPFAPAQALAAPTRAVLAEACAAVARRPLAAGDGQAALALLDAWPALRAEPRWAEPRARACALLGRDTEALRDLETALAADPGDVACQAARASILARLGRIDEARQAWTAVAAIDPRGPEAPYELGTLALLSGDMAAALRCWSEAQALDAEHAPSRAAVEKLLAEDPTTEIAFWDRLCHAWPDRTTYAQRRGRAAARRHAERGPGLLEPSRQAAESPGPGSSR